VDDVGGHSSVFSSVATDIVQGLSNRERSYLRSIILKTVQMFANNELGAWSTVFTMVGMPHARDILHDVGDSNEIGVYTDSVQSLIDRIGLAGRNLGGSVALVSSVLEEMQA